MASVSLSTVSRALHKDERISEATRLRIQAIVEREHFRSENNRADAQGVASLCAQILSAQTRRFIGQKVCKKSCLKPCNTRVLR